MGRQAGLIAALINLAVPGCVGGKPYEGATGVELVKEFAALLLPATRSKLRAVRDCDARLHAMAVQFRPVFESTGERQAASELNALMSRYRAHPYLVEDVGQPFHVHFHGDAETPVESLGGEFATALALLMDFYECKRFGVCEASECDRVYVDLTRNGSRRFCSDACSARTKTAAYRRRNRRSRRSRLAKR